MSPAPILLFKAKSLPESYSIVPLQVTWNRSLETNSCMPKWMFSTRNKHAQMPKYQHIPISQYNTSKSPHQHTWHIHANICNTIWMCASDMLRLSLTSSLDLKGLHVYHHWQHSQTYQSNTTKMQHPTNVYATKMFPPRWGGDQRGRGNVPTRRGQ